MAVRTQRRSSIVEPVRELDKIKIIECGEPLVSVAEYCTGVLLSKEPDRMGRPRLFYVRRTVASMLNRAQKLLPKNHALLIWSTYRTPEYQRHVYNEVYESFKKDHPEWPENILRRQTNRFVHPPDAKTPPGHCTGGAVDLTIVGPDGKELDMTSPYGREREEMRHVAATYDPKLSETARKNRRLLIDVMTKAGFTNYAGEWWHWSYGDSCWAWRLKRKTAIYGLIEPTEEILKILRANSQPNAS
jgi:D-alanyl-D-alanine dipeptidase